ncbi:MAG: hypothetical protein JXB44_08510, partial [Calditrichaceae bacterium]|nr:hypothetical protein [Calditrichaceae bacterium]
VPLTVEEDKAYEGIDSAMTIEKAFKPSGFLAGLVEIDDGSDKDDSTKSAFWKFMDHIDLQIWYNRVDALHAGLKPNFDLTKRIKLNFLGAYNTGSKKWAYGGGAAISFLKNKNLTAGISYEANTEAQFSSIYPVWLTSVLPLFAKDDYFDYYWREHFRTDFVYKCSKADLTMTAGFNHERHSSLIKTTDWNILGKTYIQRENPQITPGILRSAELKIAWEKERTPMGAVGNRYAEFTIERSADEFLQSDYNFTRYEGTIEWRLKTFLRRRLMMPNVLDVKIIGGYSAGNLPVQRFGGLDGNLYAFSPFGVFRTLNGKALRSDKYAALFWEHNFRTAPFELLGIKYLAKKGIGLILHGAHGRTWIDEDKAKDYPSWYPDSQKELHEIGLSVNSIFGFGRVDFTRRIDRKAFYVGFSFARMF